MMARGKFVAYYRVSTARQGRSGLGLEAQRKAVEDYLNGGRWTLIGEHTEVESGKRNDRPELAKALVTCRIHGATLIVAKLDRLSRNAAFLLTLRDASAEGVNFTAVDLPDANALVVGVMALVAQQEREAISARTKVALAAAKRRGVKLGTPRNLTDRARRVGNKASARSRGVQAMRRAKDLAGVVAELRTSGAISLRQIARGLDERDVPTPRGGRWAAAQVQRLLQRMDRLE